MTNHYGAWPSPISPEMLTQQSVKISEPSALGEDVFWIESRPNEKGRNALVKRTKNGECTDVLPEPHSVRTRAHEYGGASYLVTDEFIFCVLDADQRIYIINRNTHELRPLSQEGHYRYADFSWDARLRRLLCVREDLHKINHSLHIYERSEIVAIDMSGSVVVLVSGADFYSNPRLNSSATQLSYLCWNHPQMPWDGTECYCATLDENGNIEHAQLIAGSKTESVFQPQWSPADELYFVSDRDNWWNIYRHTENGVKKICDIAAEFATPQWVFGMSTYGFLSTSEIFCCYSQSGCWHLGVINTNSNELQSIENDFKDISGISCHNQAAIFIAASATQSPALFRYDQQSISALSPLKYSALSIDDISTPESICFSTSDGECAYGFYYSPKNKIIKPNSAERPPLIVMCHGGPTGATESSLNLKIQYWTSRGFAVLDVNYRGSTGYGRAYRDRLKNNWGVTDVIDVCSGAHYLVERGLVDKNKIAIRGSSAGGYTVLAALTFSNTFRAGASLYGIGDLEALAKDTHKFEARYLDSLVGDYPAQRETYLARSPIHHIEQLNCPVIFFQGLKDKVVPPEQAEAMVKALTKKGIKTKYVTFAEEGHGFRQANTIQQAITEELAFYTEVFS